MVEREEYGKTILKFDNNNEQTAKASGMITTMLFIAAGFLILLSIKIIENLIDDGIIKDESTAVIIFIVVILLEVLPFINPLLKGLNNTNQARLILYENRVVGSAAQEKTFFFQNTTYEEFSLSYNDIESVSQQESFLIIYTKWTTYKVYAFKRPNDIIAVINEQRRKNSEQ